MYLGLGLESRLLDDGARLSIHEMAKFLGFDYTDVEPIEAKVTEESDVEDMRRYLEDTITLLGTVDDVEVASKNDDTSDGGTQEDEDGDRD